MARKPTEYVQFKLRIRESLRRKIEKAAEMRNHSANAEAVWRIERTFTEDEEVEAHVKTIEARAKDLEERQQEFIKKMERQNAHYEFAMRDTQILEMMIENKFPSGLLLRVLMREMNLEPEWAATPESKKQFADRLHSLITQKEFKRGAPQ